MRDDYNWEKRTVAAAVSNRHRRRGLTLGLLLAGAAGAAWAAQPKGLLETIHHHVTLTSSVTDNGDLNPYAVVVAPVSAGKIVKDDVLVDNFNDVSNLQGTGTTIVDYRPSTKQTTLFARLPQKLPECPGGVGLTTAMTVLKSGWVVVGSTPSTDGTTATKGAGCLIVLDANGRMVAAWSGPTINDPWGDMAVVDNGSTATLFVSMAGFDLPSPDVIDAATGFPVRVQKATVLRLQLRIPDGKPPVLVSQTVVGNGFDTHADRDNFLLGPTGLALGPDNTLYVTDGLDNVIVAIPDAMTRTTSAGTGRVVTQGGLLSWPLAMVYTPAGHLLVCNGKDGQLVEIDPVTGKQIYSQWIDSDQAQAPPGNDDPRLPSRREFLATAVSAAAATAVGGAARADAAATPGDIEPFWGRHQGGIATPIQSQTYFAAFDLVTAKRDDVVKLLRSWTIAAARMAAGQTAEPLEKRTTMVAASRAGAAQPTGYGAYEKPGAGEQTADSGEALGLSPSRLTVTFGFGAGVFVKDGVDRYGLAQHRPEALIDLPRFNGDQLVAERTGGDLCVQACADDAQVAFHAVRQLARLAHPAAKMRWAQTGFVPRCRHQETPRNLMGFKDGTINVPTSDRMMMQRFVWVGDEGGWMKDGSYIVVRPIRIALEHWDRMQLSFQEQVVGRRKQSGAALGRTREMDSLDLDANDADGNPLIPENAHVRLAAAANNDGAQILRRPYSYDNGLSFTAERWPPWRRATEFDAGLLFVCYQRDPRAGFVKIFDKVSKFDMMNQFVTHVGGGLFACPPGASDGGFIGQTLFGTV